MGRPRLIEKTPPPIEMARFDALGPLTRAVIAESPIDIETLDMINAWRNSSAYPDEIERLWGAPLDHPEIDALIAKFLASAITKRLGHPWRAPVPRRVRHGRQAYR